MLGIKIKAFYVFFRKPYFGNVHYHTGCANEEYQTEVRKEEHF
jgi:hypothetical protein